MRTKLYLIAVLLSAVALLTSCKNDGADKLKKTEDGTASFVYRPIGPEGKNLSTLPKKPQKTETTKPANHP